MQHDFDGEEHAADRRVEGGRDARTAPLAIMVMRCHTGTRSTWPRVEANEAPIWMIGPSRPTEPPLPIDRAEASDLTTATTGRTTPLL